MITFFDKYQGDKCMCRLLGVMANKPVDLGFSLHKFREYARKNPDGWGIGWYEGEEPLIFKEGVSALRSTNFLRLSKDVTSKIIISHVRIRNGSKAGSGEFPSF